MTPITAIELASYEGKHIKEICQSGFTGDEKNHCAHFVSHVLSYDFGLTCRALTGKGHDKANVRVQEVFAKCPKVGLWDDASTPTQGLVFVTAKANVDLTAKLMKNVPKKHIGIFIGGDVWHYSNTRDKVVRQSVSQFNRHYPGSDITLFYGTFHYV